MLLMLKQYLTSHPVASLEELAQFVGAPPSAVEGMLSHWVAKGKVLVEAAPCHGGCGGCSGASCGYYRWIDRPIIPIAKSA